MATKVRGLIIENNLILLIKRIRKSSSGTEEYYVTPGGRVEGEETDQEALIREICEELGKDLKVKVTKQLYNLNNGVDIQRFYLCSVQGTIGKGTGPEFTDTSTNRGEYIPSRIRIDELPNIDLRPKKLRDALIKDCHEYQSMENIPCKEIF